MSKPQDQAQRQQVLDVSQSFIVQAPAGSGKTSLLTQRFLKLLTIVNNPEEILAITFTKKAAAEMHQRIIESIKLVTQPRPDSDFDRQTWDMATQVLQRDADCEWHLLQNPNRLRVQTIDSLCAHLTKQMPVTARFGSPPAIQQDASALYLEAARNCLQELDADDATGGAIRVLLTHVDNQLSRAESLLSTMLASRDQWLRHVLGGGETNTTNRNNLEAVLLRTVESVLSDVTEQLSQDLGERLKALLVFASGHSSDKESDVVRLGADFDGADNTARSLPGWRMLCSFLLTDKGDWRKQANAALGFPAPSNTKNKDEKALFGEQKSQYKALLLELQECQALNDALSWVRCLPNPSYSDQQWQLIEALMQLLPQAVAHLRLVFQQTGSVDFCEVSLSASHALSDASGMTDVGLKLDYQLQHMLVDEFQDTSETQFMLLKDLVAGWQPRDGRTLFLVGDPMQSIYRFRQAEVGLFLKAQEEGLGEVRAITPVNIAVNFRSQPAIVDWVNDAFSHVMPSNDNLFSGAISYKPSVPFSAAGTDKGGVHYYPHETRQAEGDALRALIQRLQQETPNNSIGVLVRGRKSLTELVQALNKAEVTYQATDIDPLNTCQTVIDLMSLTQAYLYSADRVAWLAVLRAPWCALSLSDMYVLLDDCDDANVWDCLSDATRINALSIQGQQALTHLQYYFDTAFAHKERLGLAEIIKGLWNTLLGPECLQSTTDLADSERFFDCLYELEAEGQGVEAKVLQERVEKLYAAPDVSGSSLLQIMTIHKAKGLEFDHVILPGLDRKAGNDDKRLLAWLERPADEPGQNELMIAPIKETGADDNAVAKYLNKVEQEKSQHENQRLLYVAATRAKKHLHLSFCLKPDAKTDEPKAPASNTLIGLLWPVIEEDIAIEFSGDNSIDKKYLTNCYIKELNIKNIQVSDNTHLDYQHKIDSVLQPQTNMIEFDWASDLAASVGTVCHQWMQIMGERGEYTFDEQTQAIRHQLLEAGVLPKSIDEAVDRVKEVLTFCLQDKRGQWVLNNQHEESQFELALSGVINNVVVDCRLDRTFVDDGKRWIVDYKSSRHDDDNKEQFLDEEMTRYKEQLERYACLMSALDDRPIMLGLYYPAFGGWRSWEFKRAI
ncbi:MAG: DNA helicase [Cycloclasticus sp. symbiont of Poecilosclerida sp. M]|nr:MAG: DNA helicase [Cycloclasticus sp. symbiont of Poecilosclerida sp. M]